MAPPCRLFVIPARDAPVAAVLRRGPSRWCQVIRWDTERDEFTDGAWFKGRIYEERCDLSPDGELFVYFCHGGRSRPGYTDSWTAVSRLPWLFALALWPSGTTYGGGGRFADKRSLILRNGKHDKPHPDHLPNGLDLVDGDVRYHASLDEVAGADWSGYDSARRLIFAQAGKLYRRTRGRDREIVDLDGRRPAPEIAPEWARRPITDRRVSPRARGRRH
jgi:hypothetical protein